MPPARTDRGGRHDRRLSLSQGLTDHPLHSVFCVLQARRTTMPHKITLSEAARETAEYHSPPAELERQARREIAAVLGRARFKVFNQRTMRFDITFDHAGEPFTLIARSPDAWLLETQNWERPCPPYPIIFTDRAIA